MTIKLTIDTLLQKNIPFIMTYIDNLLFDQQWHTSASIKYLQQYVEPYMTTFDGQTFLEWCKKNQYPVSDTLHPLEEAHRSAFELMKTVQFNKN